MRVQDLWRVTCLAQMNGDFDNDNLSDISDDEGSGKQKRSKTLQKAHHNPGKLDSDEEESNELEAMGGVVSQYLHQVQRRGKRFGLSIEFQKLHQNMPLWT